MVRVQLNTLGDFHVQGLKSSLDITQLLKVDGLDGICLIDGSMIELMFQVVSMCKVLNQGNNIKMDYLSRLPRLCSRLLLGCMFVLPSLHFLSIACKYRQNNRWTLAVSSWWHLLDVL